MYVILSRNNNVVLLRDTELSKEHCRLWRDARGDIWIQVCHTATHCNTLQYTATLRRTLQHAADSSSMPAAISGHRYVTLQRAALRCNILTTLARCSLRCLDSGMLHFNTLQHTTVHCNTLRHAAKLCKTLPTLTRCSLR